MNTISANKIPRQAKNVIKNFQLDYILLMGILALFTLSMLVIYSAKTDINLLIKHCVHFSIAFIAMIIIAQIPPRFWMQWSLVFYIAGILLLVAVLGFGNTSKGAQRWLNLGFIRFQPSECMKLIVPLYTAYFFHNKTLPPKNKDIILSLAIVSIPALLIALQPDLGTAILIASSGFMVIFFAGIPWKLIIFMTISGILSCPLMWYLLHDYQRERVLTLLNPERDPLGSGYHIIQSKIAIGSGGLYGRGWLQGSQSQLEFLPERSTDFIFSVFSEEFGLVGILILVAIYLSIIIRGLYIALQGKDTFCRLWAAGIIMMFFICLFVNMAMVNGLLPVVGVPLPLISYGGTSMLTMMIGFGMLMSIWKHRRFINEASL